MDVAELQTVIEYVAGYPNGSYIGKHGEGEETIYEFQSRSFTETEMRAEFKRLIDEEGIEITERVVI